jgi:two-component system phosphate regulon response regulator PhoB
MDRILIVDDDVDIQRLVSYNLTIAGFEPRVAGTGLQAMAMISGEQPELVILDLMLPDVDGNEICRWLRRNEPTRRLPIIMLTARSEEADRVLGFELGADDYLTKPFSPMELVLRIRSMLRRGNDEGFPMLTVGSIQVDQGKRECFVHDQPVALTPKEFDLLSVLLRAGGSLLSREAILDRVWNCQGEATSRTLDTHISRLREKLGAEAHRLQAVQGIGFRILA